MPNTLSIHAALTYRILHRILPDLLALAYAFSKNLKILIIHAHISDADLYGVAHLRNLKVLVFGKWTLREQLNTAMAYMLRRLRGLKVLINPVLSIVSTTKLHFTGHELEKAPGRFLM